MEGVDLGEEAGSERAQRAATMGEGEGGRSLEQPSLISLREHSNSEIISCSCSFATSTTYQAMDLNPPLPAHPQTLQQQFAAYPFDTDVAYQVRQVPTYALLVDANRLARKV